MSNTSWAVRIYLTGSGGLCEKCDRSKKCHEFANIFTGQADNPKIHSEWKLKTEHTRRLHVNKCCFFVNMPGSIIKFFEEV